MPDDRCEIELLKREMSDFKEICRERWDREDQYLMEFKKNLLEVSENLQTVINTQNKQISYVAGITTTVVAFVLSAWAVFSWFFQK
jgi:hypothetical protein